MAFPTHFVSSVAFDRFASYLVGPGMSDVSLSRLRTLAGLEKGRSKAADSKPHKFGPKETGILKSINDSTARFEAGEDGNISFSTTGGRQISLVSQAGCDDGWDNRFFTNGVAGTVYAIANDGAGNYYVGGTFTTVNGISASNIAKWNGSSWSSLGSGVNGFVTAIAVSGTTVYAGGGFTTAGGNPAGQIARWDGSSWTTLGSGLSSHANAIAVAGNDVYVGGSFTNASGTPAPGIAKWNGSTWSGLGTGVNGVVNALAIAGSDIYVGGAFTTAGGNSASGIAKWNGSNWSALGSGVSGTVNAIDAAGADVYVGGSLTSAGGLAIGNLAKWNGSTWSQLGSAGASHSVSSISISGSNTYVAGAFTAIGGIGANRIAKWDGTNWATLGLGTNGVIEAISPSGPEIYAGGQFTTAGCHPANNFSRYATPFPGIMVSGGPLNFGNRNVGTTSTALNVTVTNTGTANLVLGTPLFTTGTQFAVSNVPSSPIAPGESVFLSITFSPTSTGAKTDTVTIVSNAPGTAPTVSLSGTGVNAHFRTATNGNWTTLTTWQQSNDGGTTWGAATTTPTASNSDSIVVRLGHNIAVTSSIAVDQVSIGSGKVNIDSGGILTVNDGPGTDLIIESLDLNSRLDLQQGGSLVNNGQLNVNGWFYRFGGSSLTGNSFVYSFPSILSYAFGSQTTSDIEFPATNPPSGVEVVDAEVTLHAPRTLFQVALGGTGSFNIGANLTMQDGGFVFRTSDDSVFNGTPNYAGGVSLTYQNENITTGSEASNAVTSLRVEGVQVTLASDVTANFSLQLVSGGKVVTGSHTLSLMNGANVQNETGSGWVVGNFRKVFVSNSLVPSDRTFEVGTANGYSPVTLTYGGLGTFQQTVKAVQGAHPNVSDPTKALARHWALSNITGPGPVAADVTFKYLDIDVPATANESNFVIQKFSGGFTQPGGSVNTVANTATITNVTSFSDWTLSEPGAIGSAPIVTTGAATNVTGTTATLNGSANPNGGATTGWFRYSFSNPGTCNDSFGTRTPAAGGADLGSGTSAVPFPQGLTGLMPDATVYFCAIAQNAAGTSFGAVLSFTPQFLAATVTTNAATSVIGTSAILNGAANPNGSAATGWFRYAAANPGTCNDMFGTRAPASGSVDLGSGNSEVPFSQAISGLSSGTTYFFCAIASNSAGTAFGGVQQFTTAAAAPSVTTDSANAVTATSGTINGSANPNGAATTGWLRYSTTNPNGCNDTFGIRSPASGGSALGAGTSPVNFSRSITGLAPATMYFYCAIAENGTGKSFGAVTTFTTSPAAPAVTTNAATLVTASTATLNGGAIANGEPTTGWFRYATSNPGTCNDMFGTRAPIAGGTSIGNGTASVPYSQAVSGLNPSTTYYFCAIASNSVGIAFGSVMQFTTPGLNAAMSVSPSNLAFGSQTIGTTSAAQSITITSTGTDPLVLGTPLIVGDTQFIFTQSPAGQTVPPGQSVTVSIAFSPTSLGNKNAILNIESNANQQPSISLDGVGVAADIEVAPLALDFGAVSVALGGVAQQIQMSNLGTEDLIVAGAFSGPNASDFSSFQFNQPITIQPGQVVGVAIIFNPQATGSRSGSLTLTSNDPDEPAKVVAFSGVGINPGFLRFSSASYSGSEGAGTISVTVQRVGGSQGAVSAFFAAGGGLATAGQTCSGAVDYLDALPFANFADGDTAEKTVLITVCDDAVDENTETFDLQLFANGADVGSNTQAVVAITDNDEAGQISISGSITKADNSPLSNQTVSLAGSSTASTSTDGMGLYTFANVTSGNYIVTPASETVPYMFDPISRNYPNRTTNVTDANFKAYTPGTEPRTLAVFNGFATPGQQALVPIVLQSQGNEASLTFSLAYDPALLSGATVQCGTDAGAMCSLTVNTDTPGEIGVSVDPVTAAFAQGSREVIRVLFFTSPMTTALTTPVTFGDDPAVSETSDENANPLLTRYVSGSVVFIRGIEADVAARPNGDGSISSTDVAQVRRFAVGLDTFNPQNNEFQRADSAPYAIAGDGIVAATDVTQARRYQIGLDATQPAGGPNVPSVFAPALADAFSATTNSIVPRVVKVVDANAFRGGQVSVSLNVDAEGDENVYGFSLVYDPAILNAPAIALGADAAGANVLANSTTQAGMIGFSVDFGSGAMPAGVGKELVKVTFNIAPDAPFGPTPLTFGDAPAVRETSNASAQPLGTSYTNGFVTILAPTAAPATISGRVMTSAGRGIANCFVTATDMNGEVVGTARTGTFGYYKIPTLPSGATYLVTISSRRYNFTEPSRLVSLVDNISDMNFVAIE